MDLALCTPVNAIGANKQIWGFETACTAAMKPCPVFNIWATKFMQSRGLPAAVSPVALTSGNKNTFVSVANRSSMALSGQPVIYGAKLPNLEAVVGKMRESSRSKMKDWKQAKRDGTIVVNPFLNARLVVRDNPKVVSASATYTAAALGFTPYEDLFPSEAIYATKCNRTLYKFGDQHLSDKPTKGVVNQWTINGTYTCYKDAIVAPVIGSNRSLVQNILGDIVETILIREPDVGLVTGGTAELNAALLDVITTVAEMPETVRFIYDGLITILEMRRAAVRRELDIKATVKNVKEQVTRLAELWMSFRYGIMPIVYTVNDAVAVLEQKGVFRTVRKSLPSEITVPILGVNTVVPLVERYWGKARVDMDNGHTGLMFNPLVTALELIPLSFVLEWVLNLGDFLAALLPPSGAQELKHTYSYRAKALIPIKLGTDTLYGELDVYKTYPINPIDHLGLQIDPSMTWKRWLDALALSWFAAKSLK